MDDVANAFVPHSPLTVKGASGGVLSGLSFAVKDLYDTTGDVTGNGSPEWLAGHQPAQHTSPLVTSLLEAGADCVGKTICDEFFYSFSGMNAHYGTPLNSRAPDRMPGGSSSGSASAVAAGLCDISLGSDTGGSMRIPASFCGIYGLRPTHGRLDASCATAMAPSFDVPGWFARDVDVFRKVGSVLLGDSGKNKEIEVIHIAEFAFSHADADVRDPLYEFLKQAESALGATNILKGLPAGLELAQALESFRIIQAYETWQSFGSWIEALQPNLGPGIKERMAAAKTVTLAEKQQAEIYRARVKQIFQGLLPPGHILCLPTASTLPGRLDMSQDDMNMFRVKNMSIICLASLAGLPQVSLPAASANGIPIGLSFMGGSGADEGLLELAVRLAPYCQD